MNKEQETLFSERFTENEINMIAEKFAPNILAEWDFEKNDEEFKNISLLTIAEKSQKKIFWKCEEKQHSYQSTMRHRTEGLSCPICVNRKLLTGYNDFATKHPELLENWKKSKNNPDPTTVLFSTRKITVEWWCDNGHFYSTTPQFISRGRGCNYCNGTQILIGFNDLASKTPDSIIWWDYEKNDKKPEDFRYGSAVKVWWKCLDHGHSYKASINHFQKGRRCPVCTGKKTDETTNLTFTHPHLIEEWNFEKNEQLPTEISSGNDKKVWWKCQECSNEWKAYVYNRTNKHRPQGCPKCAKGATSSRGERQIVEFLENHGITNIEQHKRIQNQQGKRFEIDIYLPEKNIGIEFNGVYYHSEKFVDKDYHMNKLKACNEKGIRLIQIWEDDWNYSQNIVKNMLLHKLNMSQQEKVYARKTIIKEITFYEASTFLDDNHIQKSTQASKNTGLFYNDELVAVLSIKQEDAKRTFNIVRYATSKNVIGGFTKLLKYLEKTYDFDKFITFSDNCLSDGKLYESNGFVIERELQPDYMYLVNKLYREHKFNYRKAKFKNDPKLKYEENLTERNLALLNGFLRVYDAGKIKWTKKC